MKTIVFYFLLFSCLSLDSKAQQQPFKFRTASQAETCEKGTIIVKLRSTSLTNGKKANAIPLQSLSAEMEKIKVQKILHPFPKTENLISRTRISDVDLSSIYFLKISADENLENAISELRQNPAVEYAEPNYNHRLLLLPNDPNASPNSSFQYQLKAIKAYEAWDVQKGDTNMVIGIIDTGVLPTHVDLTGNLKRNVADPVNNVDDDKDGYIDNYFGWDMADSDNNPTADQNGHGTEVAGMSNAMTNNSIGVAGSSYNCKFLPLKVFRSNDGKFAGGFEAIKYAADHGAKVINLSWGEQGNYSAYEQDIINYAVLVKDVVVVAAAGNTPDEIDFYPASYNHVLSVGATNISDEKASWATWSTKIDLSAPGDAVGSTTNNGGYGSVGGTSYSSPLVAGSAALVRLRFPKLDALQVMEKLRVTSDEIYGKAGNAGFKEKLGKGRLNMLRALSDTITPSVRLITSKFENGVGGFAFYDDTVKILCAFKNYLAKTANLKITLSTTSPYVTVIQNQFLPGSMKTKEIKNNYLSPFEIYLSPNTPDSQRIVFRLGFEDGAYNDYQYFELYTSPDYLDASFNEITLTTTTRGRLGFKNDSRTLGVGMLANNQQLLGSAGVIFATSPTKVSNNVISSFTSGLTDQNLTGTRDIKYFKGSYADLETRGTLVDTISNSNKIGLIVAQKEYGWKAAPDSKFVILEYNITNFSGADIPALYSGLFADWNIDVANKNRANWDAVNKLGYVSSTTSSNMVGVVLLTSGTASYYALDHGQDNGNGINLSDGFNKAEKYNTLVNGLGKTEAGVSGEGGDVSHVLGVLINNLANRKSIKVAFAIVVGNTLAELQTNAQRARERFTEYQLNPETTLKVKFCSNNSATLSRPNSKSFKLYESLPISTPFFTGNIYQTPTLNSNKNYYITHSDEGFESEPTKVQVLKDDALADFVMDTDTIDLLVANKVRFTDNTLNAVKWSWDFGNGYKSINKSSVKVFNKQGTYKVKLIVENKTGCRDTIEKELVVVSTSPRPKVAQVYVCPGGSAEVAPYNGTLFKFYDSSSLTNPIFSGATYSVTDLYDSKTIWITNVDSTYESEPLEFKIIVWKDFAQFNLSSDTLNLSLSNKVTVEDTSSSSIAWRWQSGEAFVENTNKAEFTFHKVGIYTVSLIVTNITGCTDTLERSLVVVRKSVQPPSQDIVVCKNTNVKIAFNEGTRYRFYDSYPSGFLWEGNVYETPPIIFDRTLYVTNIDSLDESAPAEIRIKVRELTADFTMPSDTLNLNNTDSVGLRSTSLGAVKWWWDFGNGKTDTIESPTARFDRAGKYIITLVTENEIGCRDSIAKELTAVKSDYQLEEAIAIYPNPSRDNIFIRSSLPETEPVTLTIYNFNGEEVKLFKNISLGRGSLEIDASTLANGFYYIRLETGQESVVRKVMLAR